jgi:hypothetical protein
MEVRKQYQIKISNRFAALDDLNDCENINRTCKNMQGNIKISAQGSLGLYEMMQDKSWFDEERSQFCSQRKQVKMQQLQDPNKSNVCNLTM